MDSKGRDLILFASGNIRNKGTIFGIVLIETFRFSLETGGGPQNWSSFFICVRIIFMKD